MELEANTWEANGKATRIEDFMVPREHFAHATNNVKKQQRSIGDEPKASEIQIAKMWQDLISPKEAGTRGVYEIYVE